EATDPYHVQHHEADETWHVQLHLQLVLRWRAVCCLGPRRRRLASQVRREEQVCVHAWHLMPPRVAARDATTHRVSREDDPRSWPLLAKRGHDVSYVLLVLPDVGEVTGSARRHSVAAQVEPKHRGARRFMQPACSLVEFQAGAQHAMEKEHDHVAVPWGE